MNLSSFLKNAAAAVFPAALLCSAVSPAKASFLYDGFLTPSFASQPNAEYSAWDVFYSPYAYGNRPDYAAPNGDWFSASEAGVTPPPNSSPGNPGAFWDAANPTITQTASNTAFIIGAGSAGNIYSFAAPLRFELADTAPYSVGTVLFQYQADGTLTDFSSIKLQYTDTHGAVVELAPGEMLREYQSSGSSFGGFGNRTALQWDLAGLDVTSYKIVWEAASSSMSLQMASLDTSATFSSVVPASRSWNAAGTGLWSQGSNWEEGSASNENGNVRFINPGEATIVLDSSRTVGELVFGAAADLTIDPSEPSGGPSISANTGISTTAAATGHYAVNADYEIASFNVFEINAGTVDLNGIVSGAYGFLKTGAGVLTLANSNSFSGTVSVQGGTLRMEGTNSYAGATSIFWGTLVASADSFSGFAGALGSDTTAVNLGADGALYEQVGAADAALFIEGAHTIGRDIAVASSSFEKTLGATGTGEDGAVFSGAVLLGANSDKVHFTASGADDRVTFSGAISGGHAGKSVTVDGLGTVVFSGAAKNYASATTVASGVLKIAENTGFTGDGRMTVRTGAKLLVSGTLGGSGELLIDGGTVGGSGTIDRAFTLGSGDTIAPGENGIGTLRTADQIWQGGVFKLEMNSALSEAGNGWDLIEIQGGLSIEPGESVPFVLSLSSLTPTGEPGGIGDFDPLENYQWKIVTATGGIIGFDPSFFAVNTEGFAHPFTGLFSVTRVGDDLMLEYAAVPEPSSWGLLAAGAAGLALLRRRSQTLT